MSKFRVVTPKGASFTVAGGGYDYEREALDPIGAEIVEATRKGLATPITDLPQPRAIEETPTDKHRADALWAVCQCLCIGRKIDPDLVASRHDIGRLYRQIVAQRGG